MKAGARAVFKARVTGLALRDALLRSAPQGEGWRWCVLKPGGHDSPRRGGLLPSLRKATARSPDGTGGLRPPFLRTPMLCIGYGAIREFLPLNSAPDYASLHPGYKARRLALPRRVSHQPTSRRRPPSTISARPGQFSFKLKSGTGFGRLQSRLRRCRRRSSAHTEPPVPDGLGHQEHQTAQNQQRAEQGDCHSRLLHHSGMRPRHPPRAVAVMVNFAGGNFVPSRHCSIASSACRLARSR